MRVSKGPEDLYCIHRPGKRVKKFIQYTIERTCRRYEEGVWLVHESKLLKIIQLGYQVHGFVDCSDLPYDVQEKIEEAKASWDITVSLPSSVDLVKEYKTLYLHPHAPQYIVEVVWKAILKRLHPDKNPDNETEFRKFKEAYDKIKHEKEKYDRASKGEKT